MNIIKQDWHMICGSNKFFKGDNVEITLQDFTTVKGIVKGIGRSLFSLDNGQIVRPNKVLSLPKNATE